MEDEELLKDEETIEEEEEIIKKEQEETIEETIKPLEPRNEYIDTLTIQMLMNRGKYNKYIANTDPAQHEAIQTYKAKLNKYAKKIINMTYEMIDNCDSPANTDVGDTFQHYTKALIQYFEMKEIENSNKGGNEEDDETLFDPEKMEEDTHVKPSFWGKSKIVKKSGVNSYDMAMFSL